eukprot:462507_1
MQPTHVTHTISSIVNWIALIHNTSLFCTAVYKTRQSGYELGSSSLSKSVHIAQYGALFGFVLFILGNTSINPPFIAFIPCQVGVEFSVVAYWISRFGVWLFGLYRIFVAFHSKVLRSLGYKKSTLICIAVTFVICFLVLCTTSLAITRGIMMPYPVGHEEFCAYSVSDPLLSFLSLFIDQTCQCVLFVLFWRKMKGITRLAKEAGSTADGKIVAVIRKYTLLMGTNLFSTWVTLVMIVFFNPISPAFSAVDSMVNMWTILLFDARYNAWYRQIFVCCLKRATPVELMQADVVPTKTEGKNSNETSKPSDLVTCTNVTVGPRASASGNGKDPSLTPKNSVISNSVDPRAIGVAGSIQTSTKNEYLMSIH